MSEFAPLSPAGVMRRDAMLSLLQASMGEVRRVRRQRRRTAAVVGAALVTVVAVFAMSPQLLDRRPIPVALEDPPALPPAEFADNAPARGDGLARVTLIVRTHPPARVETVATRQWETESPSSPQRIITTLPSMRIVMMNDDALLAEMFALGEPTGLATLNGRTFLVPSSR
jgi:hypothetical protein